MQPNIPFAIGAGFASAVMLTAAARAPGIAAPLLFLVGLPLAVSGLASNATTSVAAAFVGSLLLGLVVGLPAAFAFACFIGLPTAILIHRTLLHRDSADGTTEWYPPGRIALWAAIIGGCISAAGLALASGGGDLEKLKAGLSDGVERSLQSGVWGLGTNAPVTTDQKNQIVQVMLTLLPGTLATLSMLSLIACLWLGGHMALAGGRLVRPWPDIATLAFPPGVPLLLAVTLGAGFMLDGLLRMIAFGFSGALFAGYVMIGLAIIHHTSRGFALRGPLLSLVYAALVVFSGGATLVLALAGLVDSFMPLRRLSTHSE